MQQKMEEIFKLIYDSVLELHSMFPDAYPDMTESQKDVCAEMMERMYSQSFWNEVVNVFA